MCPLGAIYLNISQWPIMCLNFILGRLPRSKYARTSFGVDAAAEVTISKCNLWKSRALELTSQFSHAYLTILAQCGMLAAFIKTMQAVEMQNYKNISIFCRVKPKSGEKNNNDISKNLLSTVYLKSSGKIKCAIIEVQWQTKINKMWPNRTSFQVGWSRPTPDGGTIQARWNLRAVSLFADSEIPSLLVSC